MLFQNKKEDKKDKFQNKVRFYCLLFVAIRTLPKRDRLVENLHHTVPSNVHVASYLLETRTKART